jgi:hypothetical protein
MKIKPNKNQKSIQIRDYKVDENYVLIKRDGSLPRRCVVSNTPAKAKDKVKFSFKQDRQFFDGKTTNAIKIIGLSLLAAGLSRKGLNQHETVEFSYYLSKKYRIKHSFINWTLIITIVLSIYYLLSIIVMEEAPWAALIPLSTLLVACHLRDLYKHPIKNLGYQKGFYYLSGLNQDFIQDIQNELTENTITIRSTE